MEDMTHGNRLIAILVLFIVAKVQEIENRQEEFIGRAITLTGERKNPICIPGTANIAPSFMAYWL
jgi:hypothetical protein